MLARYKMYRGELAESIFGAQTLPGFGFDVEVLFLAQKQNARMDEIAIDWYYRQESKVSLIGGALGVIDIFRVRLKNLRGDAFICEPTGNLVRRYKLQPTGSTFIGTPARQSSLRPIGWKRPNAAIVWRSFTKGT